ncbi:MAG: GlcNAc-transferase family protein [Gallionella sp.]|nr:GlcNAc-transferase family protein [Gallionella sp.]
MTTPSLPTIFVSIASYRDPDCQNTVRDLFEKAAYPERVVIGICLQIVPGEDEDCLVPTERPQQLRLIEVHASESRGACWARSRIQGLWRGEDYFFQVDSHMRFVAGWDEKLIALLGKCSGENQVLSTYPLEFTPPNQFAPDNLVTIRPKGFDDDGVLTQNSWLTPLDKAPEHPASSAFISAGMLFAPGRVVDEVPYDPYLYFTGEEITLGARLWTSGWEIYCPNEVIAYHNYIKQTGRPRHWDDQTDWINLSQRARRRLRHILGIETLRNDCDDLVEIARYGLGSTRTLAEYEAFSGLDFKGHLFKGQPLPLPDLNADQPKQTASRLQVFSGIWKDNFWGNTETRSGNGSTLAATVALRAWLPKTLDSIGAHILGDAGCGDLNWIKELTKSLRFYFGFDIAPELVNDLRSRFKDRSNCFFSEADVVMATLPECDAILCRDCLTHLTPDAALMALKGFRRSGSRYVIATTHSVERNVWVKTGGWYPMNLTAPPFNLPPPLFALQEGGTKSLGVWSTADLPK